MNKKNSTLPELIIKDSESVFSKRAKEALEAREQVNKFTALEKEKKDIIAEEAITERGKRAKNNDIIGKISIIPPDQAAVRVEFRINNGSLDIDEMDTLDALFKSARPDLFEKAKVVDKITDPNTLIATLQKAGLNPWNYLNLNVKPGQDQIIIDKCEHSVTIAEAILPKKGLLATLPGIIKHFSKEAKEYIRAYLKVALKPTVVLGTKVKK